MSKVQLAVLSPCSTCKNQRTVPDAEGRPACPRRMLRKFAEDHASADSPISPSFGPALLTGSENVDGADPDTLRNPVYNDGQGHILVWVARLEDNLGVYQGDTEVVPPLTGIRSVDSSFDTDFIHCSQLPYLVRESEAAYFQQGSYREFDAVECTDFDVQMDTQPGQVTDKDPVKVLGFARKVNVAYGYPRQKIDADLHPRGT